MLSEREEIELEALLLAEERESLGAAVIFVRCKENGRIKMNGRETTEHEIEVIAGRNPSVQFIGIRRA